MSPAARISRPDVDWKDQTLLANPYPWYADSRRHAPVHHVRMESGYEMWRCFRYADILEVLRSSNSQTMGFPPEIVDAFLDQPDSPLYALARVVSSVMLIKNGEEHSRLRGLAAKALSPRMMEKLRPRIAAIVDELLTEVAPRGEMDLLADFGAPLPIIVIAELLGLPPEDHANLKHWSDRMATVLDGTVRDQGLIDAAAAATELAEYLEGIFAARREEPRDDLISALVSVHERNDRLSENELLATVVLIMGAGHETTTNLIGNGMLALLRNPDQLELLRREPEWAASAVDELLRYDSPVQVTSRRPKEEFELGRQLIAPDMEVVLYLGAGNHDPEIFPDPEVLDIQRDASKHLAFGQGVHFCLGAALAKIEGELAIGALVERFPGLKLASQDLEWRQGSVLRGVRKLPLRF